jgi:hypothetical protein
MSLTKEQQKDLRRLSSTLSEIEKLSVENNIDLDVFISQYTEEGYSEYATEQVRLREKGADRKEVFKRSSSRPKVAPKSTRAK